MHHNLVMTLRDNTNISNTATLGTELTNGSDRTYASDTTHDRHPADGDNVVRDGPHFIRNA